MKAIVLFYSNNNVIWAKEIFQKREINCRMRSVPRHLSSDCGYCLEINQTDELVVEEILINENIEFQEIVLVD